LLRQLLEELVQLRLLPLGGYWTSDSLAIDAEDSCLTNGIDAARCRREETSPSGLVAGLGVIAGCALRLRTSLESPNSHDQSTSVGRVELATKLKNETVAENGEVACLEWLGTRLRGRLVSRLREENYKAMRETMSGLSDKNSSQ
jgi:hypothetical protein